MEIDPAKWPRPGKIQPRKVYVNQLTIKRNLVIPLVLAGVKPGEVAKRLGIPPSRVSEIMRMPDVQQELATQRAELYQRAADLLAEKVGTFVEALAIVAREAPDHSDRVEACRLAFDKLWTLLKVTERANQAPVQVNIDLSKIPDKDLETLVREGHRESMESVPDKPRLIEGECSDKTGVNP